MKYSNLFWIIPIIIITALIPFLLPNSLGIPPTPAFSVIYINGDPVHASKYNQELYISSSGDINITKSVNQVKIKLKTKTCPALQGLKSIDANGNFVCGLI